MDIWYTPERIAQQQEIAERRMARHERRTKRNARQRRRERVLGVVRMVFGYLFALAALYAFLLAAAI